MSEKSFKEVIVEAANNMRDLKSGPVNSGLFLGYCISVEDKFKEFMFDSSLVDMNLLNTTLIIITNYLEHDYRVKLYESNEQILRNDIDLYSPESYCWLIISCIEAVKSRNLTETDLVRFFQIVYLLKVALYK